MPNSRNDKMILKVTITNFEVLLLTSLVILCPFITTIESLDLGEELNCINCIGGISAALGIDTSKRCENYYCGQFQLSYTYWADAGKPGSTGSARDFEKCAKNRACAEQTIRAYFKKYKKDCDGNGKIDCADMAALHRGGPNLCSAEWVYKTHYWNAFNKSQCMDFKNNPGAAGGDYLIDKRVKNESLTPDCLDCICEAVSGCNTSASNCQGGNVCGPFHISQAYWKDGKKPGASWTACAKTKECSGVTMKNYMDKYKRDCDADGVVTCKDYAAIHRRGPQGCGSKDLLKDPYWHRFLTCRVNFIPNKDSNTVTLDNGERGSDLGFQEQKDQYTLNSRNEPPLQPTSSSSTASIATASSSPTASLSIPPSTLEALETSASGSVALKRVPPAGAFALSVKQADLQSDYESHKMMMNKEKYSSMQESGGRFGTTSSTTPAPPSYPIREVVNPVGHLAEINAINDKRSSVYQLLSSTIKTATETPLMASQPIDSSQPMASMDSSQQQLTTSTPSSSIDLSVPPVGMATEVVASPLQTAEQPANNNNDTTTMMAASPVAADQQQQSLSPILANQGGHEPVDIQNTMASPSEIMEPPQASDMVISSGGHDQLNSFDNLAHSVLTTAAISDQPPVPMIIVKAKPPSESEDLEWHQKSTHQQKVISRGGMSKDQQPQSLSPSNGPMAQAGLRLPDEDYQTVDRMQQHQHQHHQHQLQDNKTSGIYYIPDSCFECICEASSNCDQSVQCISVQRDKNRCGLYMISWEHYRDTVINLMPPPSNSGSSIGSTGATSSTTKSNSSLETPAGLPPLTAEEKAYINCSTNRDCAEKLIQTHFKKHQVDCNGDGLIDCYDVAALHRVGDKQCNSPKFLDSQYWKDFTSCYSNNAAITKK